MAEDNKLATSGLIPNANGPHNSHLSQIIGY